jgi:hypothetical protein
MDSEIIEEYFEEIKSLIYEITTKGRNGDEYPYGVDSNFKPYDVFRLPKYNQQDKNFTYENDLRRLKDKLVRFVKLEYDKEKGLRIVKLIEGEAIKNKKLYNFLNKYINQIEGASGDFDYSYFIIESMGIITNLNPNQGIWSNGFLGSYGLITKEFIWDLQDAYIFKNSSLSSLKNELIDFFDLPKNQDDKQISVIIPNKPLFNIHSSHLEKIYNFLIENYYIRENLTKEDFISIFSECKVLNQKIEWIDIAKRNKSVSIQTLFQLLHSLEIPIRDDKYVISPNIKNFIKTSFSNNFDNINSKCNEFKPNRTDRYTTIDSFIKTLNLNKS